ncbi:MAG: GAF domain-containing protein [Anaerolineae bacterium]|nr:GAF domain-containing protein [Anaerolineae bacterium]
MQQDFQSLLLQNRLLTDEVKRRIDQLAAINTVAATVSQSLDLDKTLKTALKAVLDVVSAEAGGISLIDDHAGEVVLRAQQGWVHDFVSPPMRIPLGKGMSGKVILHNDVVVDNNLDGSEELAVPRFRDEKFRSIAMAPMHARGKIIGILSIMSNQPESFNHEVVNVLRAIADTVGVALDNARLYEDASEQETRLKAIVQSTADGMIATDHQGRLILINQTAETIFDVDARKLIGTPLREAPIHPRIRDSLLYALSTQTGENKSFQATLESGRMLSLVVSPVYIQSQVEQNRKNDGWVIVVQDITHLRESELQRAEFIRAAAHDMRNPLGVALSSLNMLDDFVGQDDPTAKEIIRIATSGINRLQDLINDLLHLEQIESGYGVSMTEFSAEELIRETCIELRPLIAEKQLDFTIEVEAELPLLTADRRWVKRALINYLDNAAKYTKAGDNILVRAFRNNMLLHIEVIDNGPGIPVELQPRLFERFYRAAEDTIKGTGLGLAIVKSVSEGHGGGVYMRSQQGQGSTFGMTLLLGERPK